MEMMILPLKRYFDFSGRSRRLEFWMFFPLQFVPLLCLAFWIFRILVTIGMNGDNGHAIEDAAGSIGTAIACFGLFLAALFIPTLALQVRRFHDQGMSGWFVLLNLIPLGGFVVLALMCRDGMRGDNRYGPDPKAAMQ